jgi:hypothetical protein
MQTNSYLAAMTSRPSLYIYALIAAGLFAGFLYLFNFTTFFGPLSQ